ncbi:MAG: magnesium/cobalt transporter CorA [Nitrospirales bacterium]
MATRTPRSKKAGLPPGTLIHIGEQRVPTTRLSLIEYSEGSLNEQELKNLSDWRPALEENKVIWLDVGGIHQVGLIEQIGSYFNLHPLVLEDIVNSEQRPKVDDYDEYLYVVLKMLYPHGDKGEIMAEQVSIVLGRNYILTFQENGKDCFNGIRIRIRNDKGKIRKCVADYLLYALVDAIVDHYFVVLEKLGEQIEAAEDQLVVNSDAIGLGRIHVLKKEILYLRRVIWPVREVVNGLLREEDGLIDPSTKVYLRDVYDHTVQILETIEMYRDRTGGMVDFYISSTSQRMTAVMKVLTIITTIFMPLTFIAGVYGMNFEHMPELKWRLGYPLILTIMTGIGIGMTFYFRRKKWL